MVHKIAVVGGGVIGLTTAISIQNELRSTVAVTIFTDEVSPNTTGDVSAGLWTPYLLQNTPYDKVKEWSKATLDHCISLWKDGKAGEYGVTIQPMVMVNTVTPYTPPDWVDIAIGYQQFTDEQIKRLNREYKRNFTGAFHYISCTWEPTISLPALMRDFISNGGALVMRKIYHFRELADFDVVVNCTGLNSNELAKDHKVVPVRGQVARVKAPMIFHSFLDESDDGCYIIANINSVVLGGTHQEGDYNRKVDETDKRFILSSCYEKIPALTNQPVIRHAVGLRPGREKVRLEREVVEIDGKALKVVHNYGHGGSGITVSIGCAKEAVLLVKGALGLKPQSKM